MLNMNFEGLSDVKHGFQTRKINFEIAPGAVEHELLERNLLHKIFQ